MTSFIERNRVEFKKDSSPKSPFWAKDFQARFVATEKALKEANADLCKPEDGLDACRVLKEHGEFEKLYMVGKLDKQADAEKEALEMADRQTPDFHQTAACSLEAQKKASNAEILRQRKIASVSGVKDEKALYEAGQAIAKADAEIEQYKSEYKRLAKKELNLKKCK